MPDLEPFHGQLQQVLLFLNRLMLAAAERKDRPAERHVIGPLCLVACHCPAGSRLRHKNEDWPNHLAVQSPVPTIANSCTEGPLMQVGKQERVTQSADACPRAKVCPHAPKTRSLENPARARHTKQAQRTRQRTLLGACRVESQTRAVFDASNACLSTREPDLLWE